MKWNLQCTVCAEKFTHRGDELPDECPLCHAYIGPKGEPTITAPFISLGRNKSPDKLYTAMEKGAEHRMHMAAEATGQPVSDFASMKMSNMRDGLREGDTTFIPPSNNSNLTGNFGNATPEQVAAIQGVQQGPSPRAGSTTALPMIRNLHQTMGSAMVRAGQQN